MGVPKWITQPSFLSLGRSLVCLALRLSVLLETLGPSPQIAGFDAVIGC